MQIGVDDRKSNPRMLRRLRISGIGVLLIMGVATHGYAASPNAEWQAEPRLYLSGMTAYVKKSGFEGSFDTFATAAELEFSSRARPYSATLFADYRVSTDTRFGDIVSFGGYFQYKVQNWDATAYVFLNKTPTTGDTWLYAGRLRYRVAENHKLGIVASGAIKYSDSPALALGYFASISESLSLNILADPGINKGPDLAVHMELVWQVH